ncbi:hypothetical protein GGE07_000693 [Sinorhizobium terangae]|uniref:Uncharacterized protein n=2 Tax=Sinorhizobium terangae TaxID=110322 RepID=A0A6N7LBC4_SINTE|nr:hypothetical protein [Sinorhizobium terangae]MBB4184080.1 hypothetical protein [Sinorhizobium terangae]MQX14906.1 hypothetical protein [Sinorhizobium terangae]
MNQHEELKDKPLIDPVTGQPTPREPEMRGKTSGRSSWPLLIILLAGLVLALIAWLPAELTRDTEEATPPPATGQATPPAGQTTPPTAPQPQTTPAQPAQPAQ